MNNIKNIFVTILFLSFVYGFGQNKTVEKKGANEKPIVAPVKVNPNKESINLKGDAEVTNQKEISDYSQIFTSVEISAQPKEGLNSFRKYFSTSFRTPEVDGNLEATIQVRFVVFDDGSLHDFQILKETPIGLGLGKEAIRVLKTSENWIPGQINGKIVKQYYTFPIKIQIQGSDIDIPSSEETKTKEQANLIKETDEEDRIKKYGYQPEESSEDTSIDYTQIFTSVHEQAVPPEGMNEFRKQVSSSFKLPKVTENTIATIVAKFVVWDDGSIKDVVIVKETPANLGLGKEAIRILSSSKKWKPGIFKGKTVKQYYTLPIMIQITPAEKTEKPVKEVKK